MSTVKYWAVIVETGGLSEPAFHGDAAYMRHVLLDHYNFNGLYLLSNYLQCANDNATEANMNWTIENWLFSRSDSDDVIFIFFSNHGGGYNTKTGQLTGGRYHYNSTDEGSEHYISGQWKGVDEYLCFYDEYWYDDEIKAELDYLGWNNKYGKLVLCVMACFSGGLVDDLAGPNRIIMNAANETYTGHRLANDSRLLDEWPARFIDALRGEEGNFSYYTQEIVHLERSVDADDNNDGHVSMWEAWNYAWQQDAWREAGYETPWLGDSQTGYPTYKKLDNESTARDHGDPYFTGDLAQTVYFPRLGGGGCPTLLAWNGADYVEDGALNIHAHSDMILDHKMTQPPRGFPYRLQLRELDGFTSQIDHVRLYAVDEHEQRRLCPLMFANHSETGATTWIVMFNDDRRIDLRPSETLDMSFLPSMIDPAYFIFEISGYNQKQP